MNYTNSLDDTPFQNNIDNTPFLNNIDSNLTRQENKPSEKVNYIDNPETIIYQYPIDNEEHLIDNEEHLIDNEEQEKINKIHRESISNHISSINKDLDFIYRYLDETDTTNIEEKSCCSKNCVIM